MTGEIVLVVDDRIENINFIQQYVLEPNGYQVLTANNGLDALNIALSQSIDLIISDLIMPKMGGLELLASLSEANSPLPTILTTLYGSEETAVRAFRLGAKDYIMKPYTVEEMLTAIDKALNEVRLRQERDALTERLLQANSHMENRVKELQTLNAIGHSVSTLSDEDQILNRIVEAAIYVSDTEDGAIMLLDDTGDLYLRTTKGIKGHSTNSHKVKVDNSIVGQVIETGEPIIIGGQDENESFKVSTNYFAKSMANVPLKCGTQVIGVLAVSTKEKMHVFKNRHLELLLSLADYASIAIEYARLYAQVAQLTIPSDEEAGRTTGTGQYAIDSGSQLTETDMLASLRNLAAGIAHELSPSISSIVQCVRGIADVAEKAEKIEEPAKILLDIQEIERECIKCRQIINRLRDYASQEMHTKKQLDLNEIIKLVWKRIKTDANYNKNITINQKYDLNLGPVIADQDQLEQGFFYILQNTLQSMPQGGGTLHIITRAIGNEAQVIIADTGEGIQPGQMRHIFDPFYKSSRYSDSLGLSITYSIIERHNGIIEVDSKGESGVTFTIRLPVVSST